MQRRSFILAVAATAATTGGAARAQAGYPDRTIRIVVPFLPGGSPDIVARTIGERLARVLGQPIVIDNKPGANGIIGVDAVVKAPADGYTLLLADTGQLSINPSLYRKLPYATLRDLAPITQAMATPMYFVVRSDLPVKDLKELVAYSQTGKGLPYGSNGVGSVLHLGIEMFRKMSGAKLWHIPYKGVVQLPPALLAGDIALMFSGWAAVGPHIKAGKLKALAVASAQRASFQPEIPTVAESGFPGFEVDSRNGLLAPAGTPVEVVDRLAREVNAILEVPEVREKFASLGIEVLRSSPKAYAEAIRRDEEKYARVVVDVGAVQD